MFPLIFDPKAVMVGLAGAGDGLARRQATLADAGIVPIPVAQDADSALLRPLKLLLVAGFDRSVSEPLAHRARAQGVLVNVEDVPDLCDFHIPATVRRGDLVLTASTGGQAPGLARQVREWLENAFGSEWAGNLDEVRDARSRWRAEGRPPGEVSGLIRGLIAERGWLA